MPIFARPEDDAGDTTFDWGLNMKNKITFAIVLAAAVGGGLIGTAVGVALGGDSSTTAGTSGATQRTLAVPVETGTAVSETAPAPEQIYRHDAPGVVVITDTQTQRVPPTLFTPAQTQRVSALGSGFVIDRKGDIVTNDHVVQGASGIRVGFSSGASYPAKIVGTDPSTDIAVVRVKASASALHPLAFADSSAVQVGDPAYAIGNPFGLERTMTGGMVSAIGRDIQAPNGLTIPNAIQTDAAINHGNSGGPLLDGEGRDIGVNDQIESGTVDGNVGVGFAISSDAARSVAAQLIASGHADHAWLGVAVETIDPSAARVVRGLPDRGVAIARVIKGGPAAKAGFAAATHYVTVDGVSVPLGGDAIVAVDGKPLGSTQQLSAALAPLKPGDHLTFKVVRAGKRRSVTVTLGNVPRKA
ncbi:MAG TPA: trypsin-like peptidase domain-containing protein [Gaiellaceae bacterium]